MLGPEFLDSLEGGPSAPPPGMLGLRRAVARRRGEATRQKSKWRSGMSLTNGWSPAPKSRDLTNGYDHPFRLGYARWVAMIGA
jgi:hypothetical protein